MEFENENSKVKKDKLKLNLFWVVAAIALFYDRWYEHNNDAELIRFSIFLICFGFPLWRFNEVMVIMIKESRAKAPKYIRFLGVTPNPEILKFLGISTFGVGCLLLISCLL